ncbi:MAG: dihydrodipicolinate synthase family protein [Proteobacteria bacterium]|nr:dihydrodipicolinate synthase family protein [Pseudomonadota bacterium]
MKYKKSEAKSHALATMKGIWAAALTPFTASGAINEEGVLSNYRHWIDDLKIDGFFVAGKQGEFFSMSLDERKRAFDLAVKACAGKAQTIMSCSDQNMDTVIELARYAQNCGADYIVVHAPILHFHKKQDETLMNYYRTVCGAVDIGVALWSHPDSGYLMSPELCNRLADIENVVAIKYSVPREMYKELHRLASDRIIVSTASEEEWLDNIEEMNWRLYLCSSPPYLIQSKNDRRMREYTDLAFAGKFTEARKVRDSLEPVRHALKSTRPPEKPHSHQKYWQGLLGQVGGHVRTPLLELTEAEKAATKAAFETCGLKR